MPEYLYLDKDKPQIIAKPIKVECLVIELENSNSICIAGAVQTFLYKMLSAIGLDKKQVLCIKINANDLLQELVKYKPKTILLTSPQLKLDANNAFNIHHPSVILKDEILKREAWEVLKQVKVWLK